MKSISLKLSNEIAQQLSAIAREQKTNKSEIMRDALAAYLTKNAKTRPGSCLALATDLAGCVEGPKDLSVDKQRMNGFGT